MPRKNSHQLRGVASAIFAHYVPRRDTYRIPGDSRGFEITIHNVQRPKPPTLRLSIGVTGHRSTHKSYPSDFSALHTKLGEIFDRIDMLAERYGAGAPVRLHTLLADGTDQVTSQQALERDWELVAPLPFGRVLNRTIGAHPLTASQAAQVLSGKPTGDSEIDERVEAIASLEAHARIFEIAEQDDAIADLLMRHLREPEDGSLASSFLFETSQRFAIAGKIMVEQSDLVVAVWDGKGVANVGGTGDTVKEALDSAVPVLRIDPADPENWCVITSSEMLSDLLLTVSKSDREQQLETAISHALNAGEEDGFAALADEKWHGQSAWYHHAYRRTEALFGSTAWTEKFSSMRQRYETPDRIAEGSGASVLQAIADISPPASRLPEQVANHLLAPFAWIDGVSTRLSDHYRSGMVVNFVLGSLAIIAGVLYLPLGGLETKWIFACIELALLQCIVINTAIGQRRGLHERWFATRRMAEYLRQRPLMVATGVARPIGQWPEGESSAWPELYARQAQREIGLPEASVDKHWLRGVLNALRDLQVVPQRDYHAGKSKRLSHVHHSLDRTSEGLFAAAIVSVAIYLALFALREFGMMEGHFLDKAAKWFTVAGVAFPTVGGALAGIRYFGDFERFADISEVTANQLDAIAQRIAVLSEVGDDALQFGDVAALLHATDAIVMSELESWQAVFSGKRIAVPA